MNRRSFFGRALACISGLVGLSVSAPKSSAGPTLRYRDVELRPVAITKWSTTTIGESGQIGYLYRLEIILNRRHSPNDPPIQIINPIDLLAGYKRRFVDLQLIRDEGKVICTFADEPITLSPYRS